MTKNERLRNLEMLGYFRNYRANKRAISRMAAEKATEGMSVDYSKPSVVSGGGNAQEDVVISIIEKEDILRRKCAVVEKTVEHYIGDVEMQDIIRNLLLRDVNIMRYSIIHNKHFTNVYHLRNKILTTARRWASFYGLTQDSNGGGNGDMFSVKIEKK